MRTYLKAINTLLAQEPHNDQSETELLYDCPLPIHQSEDFELDGEKHFFIDQAEGLWHCKHCDETGNIFSLITGVHNKYLEATTKKHYRELSELRHISISTLQALKFAYDEVEERWLVPFIRAGSKKTLAGIGYFYWRSTTLKSRYVVKKLSNMASSLYLAYAAKSSKHIFICEGEWDAAALIDLLRNRESGYQLNDSTIFGKPGSGFTAQMFKELQKANSKDTKIILLLDNDKSGREQTKHLIDFLLSNNIRKSKIQMLDWSLVENAPKDIRDMLAANRSFSELEQSIVPIDDVPTDAGENVEEKELTPGYAPDITIFPPVPSFQTYVNTVKTLGLTVSNETEMAMAACLAVTQGLRIPGEPIWTFLKAPASSGKTRFIDSFGGCNQLFESLSKLTPKALITGAKLENNEPWGIEKWRDKTVLIKDFTTTCMGGADQLREVFGLMTDIFDGHSTFTWGNGKILDLHNLYFNIIAGVTDIINAHSAASIGERFLRIDYLGEEYDPMEYAMSAIDSIGKSNESKERMTEATLGFINHLHETPLGPIDEYKELIAQLAVFTAYVRTRVESDRQEGIIYRPRAELPPRLSIIFGKLFMSLQAVYYHLPEQLRRKQAFKVVQKIAFDTCSGFGLDIVKIVNDNPTFTRKEIVEYANIQPIRAHRVLNDLVTTETLIRSKPTSKRVGKPAWHYRLHPNIAAALKHRNESKNNIEYIPSKPRPKKRLKRQ